MRNTVRHDSMGLHENEYYKGAPLASQSGVLHSYTLLICKSAQACQQIPYDMIHAYMVFDCSARHKEC